MRGRHSGGGARRGHPDREPMVIANSGRRHEDGGGGDADWRQSARNREAFAIEPVTGPRVPNGCRAGLRRESPERPRPVPVAFVAEDHAVPGREPLAGVADQDFPPPVSAAAPAGPREPPAALAVDVPVTAPAALAASPRSPPQVLENMIRYGLTHYTMTCLFQVDPSHEGCTLSRQAPQGPGLAAASM